MILFLIFSYFFIFSFNDFFYNIFCLKSTKLIIFFRFFLLLFIFLSFFIFFRLLCFFSYREPIDLKEIFNSLNILFFFITIVIFFHFFITVYKFLIFYFKYNFLKQHFFFMNKKKFKWVDNYIQIIYFLTSWNYKLTLFFFQKNINIVPFYRFFYFFFRYFFDLIMLLLFFIDLFCFNKILILSMGMLPYYGMYKFFFNLNYFFIFKLDLKIDFEISNIIYSNEESNLIFKPKNFFFQDEYFFQKRYIHSVLLDNYII